MKDGQLEFSIQIQTKKRFSFNLACFIIQPIGMAELQLSVMIFQAHCKEPNPELKMLTRTYRIRTTSLTLYRTLMEILGNGCKFYVVNQGFYFI